MKNKKSSRNKKKIGRPTVEQRRQKSNFSLREDVIKKVNQYVDDKKINTSELLEKLILAHISKNS